MTARTFLLIPILGLIMWGCVSTQTTQNLERSYRLASVQIRERDAKPAPLPALTGPLDRDTVVELAVSRSPSLASTAHRARALVHAARAEGSLPASELGVQAWNLPLARPYATGEADMYMVELRQRFPAAGSLDARARASAEEAQALLAEVVGEERLTAQRAADAYADYVRGHQDHALHHQHLALLEQLQHAVQARFTTGGAGLADAARVELELAKTRRAIARVQGDIARARSTINALLRRPTQSALGEPREFGAQTIRIPLETLLARAAEHRGTQQAADAKIRAARARRDAAEAEARVPEFMLGIGYWQEPGRRAGIGATASMSLPWLWGPQHHRVDEAQELEAAEVSSEDAASIELQAEVTSAHAKLTALENEVSVVRDQAVPAALRSIEAIRAAYTTGNASLLEWLDAARSVLDLEMEQTELNAKLAQAVAEVERAVGMQLPRIAIANEKQP